MADLNERVKRLEDRAAINDLVVAYFLAADGDDLATLGACFTEDATFSASGQLCASGRQGIMDFIKAARSHMGLTVHTPHYAQVTFDSCDEARGLVGAHLELVVTGSAVCGAVRYVDRYLRREGRWRIVGRDMRTIYIAPWLEVGQALASKTPVRWPGGNPSKSDYTRS
jgi:ketosteroid isomerase-like protein